MKKTRLLSLLFVSAAFVLASCGGNNDSSHATGLTTDPAGESSTSSHATGLTTEPGEESSESSHATGLTTEPGEESSHATGLTTEPVEESSEPEVAVNYYLVGSFNSWATKDENYLLTPVNEQIDGKTVLKSATLPLKAGTSYKVVDEDENWFPTGMGNDSKITEDGDYVITFVPAGGMVGDEWNNGYHKHEKVGEYSGEVTETNYYLVGSFNSWAAGDEALKMSKTESVEDKDVYVIEKALAQGDEFKVVSSDNIWYPDAGNIMVESTHTYQIFFAPEGGITEDGWTQNGQFKIVNVD